MIPEIKHFTKTFIENNFGISIKKYSYNQRLSYILDKYFIKTIIDVGANKGQFIIDNNLFKKEKKYLIHSFEPLSSAFKTLKLKSLINKDNWLVYNFALGNENTNSVINIPVRGNESSSFLDSSKILYSSKEDVFIKRFDDIEIDIKGNVFVKIDVQGYELEVLYGMINFINNHKPFFIIETCLIKNIVYENSSDLFNILNFMKNLNYECKWIHHNIVSIDEDFEYDILFVPNK